MTELTLGSEFAGCRIEAIRGRGGMGVVYRARDLALDRLVAIKLINDELAGDETAHRRFEREARLMASIDHPNVIPVYGAGEEDGHLYLLMRYVEGTDLQALLRSEGSLSPARAARITDQVAQALDAAHRKGLVHRDIKPSNVLLSGDHAYLTDFGITRLVDERTTSTDAGRWIGTFDYMSPEQLRGEGAGASSDIYALGCLLYACLAGSPPFQRETAAATITAHLHEEPPSLAQVPGVPRQFDSVVRRALAKRPRDRYGSAGELGAAALAAAEGRRGRPWRSWRSRRRPVAVPEVSMAAEVGVAAAMVERPAATEVKSDGRTRVARTEVRSDGRTRLAKTAVMPPPAGATRSGAPVAGRRPWRARPRAIDLALLGGILAVAVVLVAIVLSSESAPRPAGPLTAAEIRAAVHDFASDYSTHDVHALARLLAADVTRVDPVSTQRGRAAVLREYRSQFVTKPVPTRYVLNGLTVTPGWAGRAEGRYTLTVTGGGTLSGREVFGLQRSGGRVQVALISTQ